MIGFEPIFGVCPCQFSKLMPSTTQPPTIFFCHLNITRLFRVMGVEPIISCSQNKRIDRSATPLLLLHSILTGMIGIEPIFLVLETNALPLNYTPNPCGKQDLNPRLQNMSLSFYQLYYSLLYIIIFFIVI